MNRLNNIEIIPRATPHITLRMLIVSTSENIGARTLARNTRLKLDVKSASWLS